MKNQLKNIERGNAIPFAGYEWIVLEHDAAANTTLVLMADILENRAFDDDNNADWRQSSARKHLNGAFLDNLTDAADGAARHIMKATVNLMAEDGTFRETCTDNVFLLSCDQYRKHRDIIAPLDGWWWTLTRYSASNSYYVRSVNTDGTLYYNYAYNGYNGLRPALLLSSDLLISDIPELSDETLEELAAVSKEAGVSLEAAIGWIKTILASLPKKEADDE
ncbi:MAG: DUF6273 domain-containing protein [Candidatus Dehalobacter alkaniphilus]